MSRPRERGGTGEQDLFRSRLDQIINMKHELVRLAQAIIEGSSDDASRPKLSGWEELGRERTPPLSSSATDSKDSRSHSGGLLARVLGNPLLQRFSSSSLGHDFAADFSRLESRF